MSQLYMKLSKLLLLIILILATFPLSLKAQLVLQGQVRDSLSLVGIPGHAVFIKSDTTLSPVYTKTVYTNSQGFFNDVISPSSTLPQKFYVSTFDCNMVLRTDSILVSIPNPVTFSICSQGMSICFSDFIAYPDSGNYNQIHFFNLSNLNSTNFLWNFGDGSSSTAQHPSHIYNYGSYLVCLTSYDTLTNCSHTFCDTVQVSPQMNCDASFVSELIGNKKYRFTGDINSAYPTLYYWDFGDTQTANGKVIQHQYLQPGNYMVTLTSISYHPQTMDTCISFSYDTLSVSGSPTAGVWGQIFADTQHLDFGKAYLYSIHPQNQTWLLIDSCHTHHIDSLNLSYYSFQGLEYGQYSIKVRPTTQSQFYTLLAPAYVGNTIYWNQAQLLNLNQVSTSAPINLTHLFVNQGYGSIQGTLYEDSKAKDFNPVAKVPIYLLDQNFVVVRFVYTNAQGLFSFQNLSYQKYYVYADIPNYTVTMANTILDPNQPNQSEINLYVQNGAITPLSRSEVAQWNLYPNPAHDYLILEGDQAIEGVLEIYDAQGRMVRSTLLPASSQHKINLHLQAGVYLVYFRAKGDFHFIPQKLVIK